MPSVAPRPRRDLLALLGLVLFICVGLSGCGSTGSGGSRNASGARQENAAATGVIALHGRPQVVDPVAGVVPGSGAGGAGASADAVAGSAGVVSVDQSGTHLAQPVSNVQVEQELSASGINPNPHRATLTASGLAIPPADAPPAVVAAIQAGNQIAHLPYVWGGGHGRYQDTGYDCSGSLSFILAAAGMLNGTLVSGDLASFGAGGPGRWITIFANAGHTFAIIAGLRFDTVALAETGTRWSNRPPDEDVATFAIRHPPGY